MNAGVILLLFGAALILLGMTTNGLKISFAVVRTTVSVKDLTTSQVFRTIPLVLGVLLVATGTVVLVLHDPSERSRNGDPIVIVPGGGGAATAYNGPSTRGYSVSTTVPVKTHVHVICTVYAQPLKFGATNVNLWDYTDHGWLNDHFVSTGVIGPTAPGCKGTVAKPMPGTDIPTRASGPYAVITDEGIILMVRKQPALSAPETGEKLAAGTFVRLACTVTAGPDIPAPRALGANRSNNVWDRLVGTGGYIPDSYLATYSIEPIAPPCQ